VKVLNSDYKKDMVISVFDKKKLETWALELLKGV